MLCNVIFVRAIAQLVGAAFAGSLTSAQLLSLIHICLGHDRRYGIDPTKIKNDLGWYPETPFEKGIVLTIDWYPVSYTHLAGHRCSAGGGGPGMGGSARTAVCTGAAGMHRCIGHG